jgi:hypothetical protein
MKKFVLFFVLFAFATVASVNAQSASKKTCTAAEKKACAAGDKKACTKSAEGAASAAAVKLANESDDIVSKTCAVSGKTTYFRKDGDQLTEVSYCTKAKKFVNVSPSGNSDEAKAVQTSATEKKACAAGEKKACCAQKGNATKVSMTEENDTATKKACTAGAKKACCAKKAAKTEEIEGSK